MVQMKIDLKGSGVDVNKSSGFEPYEGPVPRPGVYAAIVRVCRVKVSQAGNPYFNVMVELADQHTPEKQQFQGAPVWERYVPGPSDFAQEKVAKLLHTLSGKDPAKVNIAIVHDEVTDGGKVTKVGGQDPVGVKAKVILRRGSDNNGDAVAEIQDIFPWPKGDEWPSGEHDADSDEEIEEEELEEEEDADDEADDEADDDEELDDEEEEEDDEEEDDDDAFEVRQAELSALGRVELKKILAEVDPEFKPLKRHTEEDFVNAILDVEFPEDGEADEEDPF